MGYYGLGPGMKVADPLTPFEQSLRALPADCQANTLDTLETLFRNIAQNPREEKYRKIKLSNARINDAITSVDAALEALLGMGWELCDDADTLTLPMSVEISFPKHVNGVLEAKQFFRKEEEKERVAKGLGRIAPTATQKSAFQFADRRKQEDKDKAGEDNLRRLRQEQKTQFEVDRNRNGCVKPSEKKLLSVTASVSKEGSTTVTETHSPKNASAGSFESRAKRADANNKAQQEHVDLRALQKQKYKNFKADPNAGTSEAYKQPASLAANAKDAKSEWYNPLTWFGGGSSSGDSGKKPPGGGKPNNDGKPKIKGIGDLPKPVQRGG